MGHTPLPMRRAPALDTALLLVALVVAWQLLAMLTGAEVLTTPAATVRRLAQLMGTADFARHAWETGRAFAVALAISLVGGLLVGALLGARVFEDRVIWRAPADTGLTVERIAVTPGAVVLSVAPAR